MSENRVNGDLGVFGMPDVVQSLSSGRKDAAVVLERDNKRGYLYFLSGQIVSALDDNLQTGDQAALHLLGWTRGTFTIEFDQPIPERNVKVPTEFLMLELARNLDEVQRDHAERGEKVDEDTQSEEARQRLDLALSQKLHQAFDRVATETKPGRAIYSPQVFDPLLATMKEHAGSALFLEPGAPPRIRRADAFVPANEESITPTELEGFLNSVLTEREWTLLREQREVSGCYQSPELGTFRVHVAQEWGRYLVTFSPTGHATPPLSDLCTPELASSLCDVDSGLIVIAGPVGSGKAMVTASMIQEKINASDRFAVCFAASQRYTFEAAKGMGIYRELPPPGVAFHVGLRGALDQGADIIGVVGALERESFHLALGAAGGNRLVIYSLESHSVMHTLQRLFRFAHTEDGDPLLDALANTLRYVVDLRPTRNLPEVEAALEVNRDVQEALRTGAIEILKSKRLAALRGV